MVCDKLKPTLVKLWLLYWLRKHARYLISYEAIHHYTESFIQNMISSHVVETGYLEILVSVRSIRAFNLALHIRVREPKRLQCAWRADATPSEASAIEAMLYFRLAIEY